MPTWLWMLLGARLLFELARVRRLERLKAPFQLDGVLGLEVVTAGRCLPESVGWGGLLGARSLDVGLGRGLIGGARRGAGAASGAKGASALTLLTVALALLGCAFPPLP